MKQGVVHLQAARHEAVRRADAAVKIQQDRLAAEDSLSKHNDALLALTASKVICLDVSLKCQVALHF